MDDRDFPDAQPMFTVTVSGSPHVRAMLLTAAVIVGGLAAACLSGLVLYLSGCAAAPLLYLYGALGAGLVWRHREKCGTGPGMNFNAPEINALTIYLFVAFLVSIPLAIADVHTPEGGSGPWIVGLLSMFMSLFFCIIIAIMAMLTRAVYLWSLERCTPADLRDAGESD